MTPEEKQLLLKTLSAHFPYGVKVLVQSHKGTFVGTLITITTKLSESLGEVWIEETDEALWCDYGLVKPYLRPMSSITDEEKKGLLEAIGKDMNLLEETLDKEPLFRYGDNLYHGNPIHYELDFLISHHFDYRGLIEKGLALEAPEGMYN